MIDFHFGDMILFVPFFSVFFKELQRQSEHFSPFPLVMNKVCRILNL